MTDEKDILDKQVVAWRKEVAVLQGKIAFATGTRAVSPSEWQVPEGWKLVPIEPTEGMLAVGVKTAIVDMTLSFYHQRCRAAWLSMLAAAPPNNHNREGA